MTNDHAGLGGSRAVPADHRMDAPSSALVGEVCQPILGRNGDTLGVERMTEGGSTYVYRVTRSAEMFYVRVLPEEGASFGPEVAVHEALLARGVRVPEVVFWEHLHAQLGCSLMVTTAVQGRPVRPDVDKQAVPDVLRAGGRDLARANGLPVDGWGFVTREPETQGLRAPFPSARAWLNAHVDNHLAMLEQHRVVSSGDVAYIRAILSAYQHLFDHDQPRLAHGDFDPGHIFIHDGHYSGIIDWGEIRGAQRFYDLGHFAMENRALLPDLLAGYAEIVALPADIAQRIHLTSLLIAVERLGNGLRRRPEQAPHAPYVVAVERAIRALRSNA